MRVQLGLKSCLLVVFLSAFANIAKAGDLAPGSYRIASAMNDPQRRCFDKRTQDNYSIQMFPCNNGPEQVFTVGPAPDGNLYIYDYHSHPLGLSGQSDSANYLVNIIVSTGTPETPNIKPATWQFQKNTGDGNFAILCESYCQGYPQAVQTGCVDRRNPDGPGRVQVIGCYGILGQQWIISQGAALGIVKRFSIWIPALIVVLAGLVIVALLRRHKKAVTI